MAIALSVLMPNAPRRAFEFGGTNAVGPSIAMFVTVLSQDVTFGKTLQNVEGCIVVAAATALACAGVLAASGDQFGPAVALPLVFVFAAV